MVTTYTDTATVSGIAKGTFQQSISTSTTVLRTAQEATIGLAVIHGSTATWPSSYTPFTANMAIPNPTVAPTVSVGSFPGSSWPSGTYSVSYTYCVVRGINTPPTQTSLPSPAATATITVDYNQALNLTAPGPLPPQANGVTWYVGQVDPNTGKVTRTFDVSRSLLTFPNEDGSYWSGPTGPTEPTSNTSVVTSLFFGRSDDESGNVPVPIPQATPTTSYSWYKIVQAVVVPNGFGNTTITNLAIAQSGIATTGLNVFYRVVTNYVQCNGTSGLPTDNLGNQTGYYPPDDLTAHTGSSANTPAGYNPLPTTPVVIANGPFTDSTSGPIGPYVQLVLGVADRSTMTLGAGQLTLPQVTFYYDET